MGEYAATRLLYELLKPEVILWDDAESHLNPRVIVNIAEWLSDINSTVVLATQSLELAETMLGIVNDGKSILLSLSDGLKSKVLNHSELEDLIEAGIDARVAEGFLI